MVLLEEISSPEVLNSMLVKDLEPEVELATKAVLQPDTIRGPAVLEEGAAGSGETMSWMSQQLGWRGGPECQTQGFWSGCP